ncbi:hypothetical protein H310_04923 [Aphanomyces invadans]|uniref:PH domain-containing protein n=1 Tax=Aphanomyces invadans TaxID=157072 RepID=A0A024UB34_9STRA|nr:hypothetical protein H310_04923 [Aphanomyces invadans]ETW03469.1 hypothetical protein H310_04923 [Aphanomyces invadans]|eukprot:XP_008867698.1 hypothetical protein H310_04923 [Aphanomyces invadans]
MGNSMCCGMTSYEAYQREEALKEGAHFRRHTALFGMLPTTDRIFLRLNATGTRLEWTLVDEPSDVARTEAIHLDHVAKIMPTGKTALIMYAASGKRMLEITAKDAAVRDLWARTLMDVLEARGVVFTSSELSTVENEMRKQEAHDKQAYWRDRTETLALRQALAAEKKKSFANVGMRYTAQAMASR